MEQSKINFNWATMGKEVAAFVRARAIEHGTSIFYKEDGKIIEEDPRTGQKTVVRQVKK